MKKWVIGIVGILLGAAMIWLLFRDTDWGEVRASLRGANWWLLTSRRS